MNDATFDGLSRRASLLGVGAAGVAALAVAVTADARNKGKKKAKKKAKKKCQSQVDPCTTLLGAQNCEPDDEACLAQVAACCQLLANCDFTAFGACLSAGG